MPFQFSCQQCGDVFLRGSRPTAKDPKRFCSRSCADLARRRTMACPVCGVGFVKLNRVKTKHCSRECSDIAQSRAMFSRHYVRQTGYFVVRIPGGKGRGSRRWMLEQRLVAEQVVVCRPLDISEVVHHINGDKLDNRPENLRVMTRPAHAGLHGIERGGINA
jgi:hypothetical protein